MFGSSLGKARKTVLGPWSSRSPTMQMAPPIALVVLASIHNLPCIVQFKPYEEDAQLLGVDREFLALLVKGEQLGDVVLASDHTRALERTLLHPNVTEMRCAPPTHVVNTL